MSGLDAPNDLKKWQTHGQEGSLSVQEDFINVAIRFLTEFFADHSSQDLPEIDVMGVWLWPRGQQKLMWAMKKRAPGWLGYIGDEILPMLYRDYNNPWNKDPYKPTKNFHGKFRAVFFFRGSLWGERRWWLGVGEKSWLDRGRVCASDIFSLNGLEEYEVYHMVTGNHYEISLRKNRGWKKTIQWKPCIGPYPGGGNSNIFLIFTPKIGEMIPIFDEHIFQMRVKPPTRLW